MTAAPSTAAEAPTRGALASALPERLHLTAACVLVLAPIPLLRFGIGAEGLVGVLFVAVLVALALKDLEERRIPNVVVLPATAVVLVAVAVLRPSHFVEALVAAVAAGAFLLVPSLFARGAVGIGDVKLALLLGAGLGKGVALGLFLGCLAASVAGGVLVARRGLAARKTALPFAPFLVAGALAAIALGAPHAL